MKEQKKRDKNVKGAAIVLLLYHLYREQISF